MRAPTSVDDRSGTGSAVVAEGSGVEHGVGALARLDELQPLPGLLLDVGRVAPALALGLEGGDVLLLGTMTWSRSAAMSWRWPT